MDDLKSKYLTRIADAADEAALEEIRLAAVGKKGEVALKMRELGKMTPEERQVAGPALNALKDEINSALAAKRAGLADAALDERLRNEWLDVTLPSRNRRQGTIHPISQVSEEVTAIFAEMGFSVVEGPRIDTDWYNFDALEYPRAPPGTGRNGHVLYAPGRGRRSSAARVAYPYLTGPDPVDGGNRRADPHHLPRSVYTALTMIRHTRRCFTKSKALLSTKTSRWQT